MDESQDLKPHPHVNANSHPAEALLPVRGESLSIWFFVGILTLAYGVVLIATGIYEHFGHQPNTILANLEPTFWWGVLMTVFGTFYTTKFRPGKG
jgi:hypothetical protein